jgi:hypothetical protein
MAGGRWQEESAISGYAYPRPITSAKRLLTNSAGSKDKSLLHFYEVVRRQVEAEIMFTTSDPHGPFDGREA